MNQIFLGMPPPNIASWMKAHTKPSLERLLKTPFYVVSDTDNTLIWTSTNDVKINWSLNEDLTDSHALPVNTRTQVPMQAGKKLYLFCSEDQPAFLNVGGSYCQLNCTSKFSIGGNACFLSEASCYKKTEFQPACRNAYQFSQLFSNSVVADASSMVLGFSTLTDRCYYAMFQSCISLLNAPMLPATALASNCYFYMFSDCEALANAPQLPATTLAQSCYANMFQNCISLVAAPQLPATTLAITCYSKMFSGCEALANALHLPATTFATNCYTFMLQACDKIQDLYFPKSIENDKTFFALYGAPNFGATNATVHYDL